MSTSPSPPSRIEELIRTTPPVTLGVITLCCFLFGFVQVLFDIPLQRLTLSPARTWSHGQWQRVISGALFHHDFLHLAMNMMSTLAIGSLLERQMGSLRLLSTILLSIVVTGLIYMMFVLILVFVFQKESWMNQDVIGFSGVLFHLSVLECNLGTALPRRNLFGVVEVPSYVYPWVLLVLLQIIIPNLSFLGHLSGIIAGTCQVYGFWSYFLPSEALLQRIERHSSLHWLTSYPSFVSSSTSVFSTLPLPAALRDGLVILRSRVSTLPLPRSFLERLRRRPVEVEDDDDDWNGLPEPGESDTASLLV